MSLKDYENKSFKDYENKFKQDIEDNIDLSEELKQMNEEIQELNKVNAEPDDPRPWEKLVSKIIYTDGRPYKCPECGSVGPIVWTNHGFTQVVCGHTPHSNRCKGCNE